LPHQTIIVFFSVYVVHGPDRIKLKKILTKSKFVPKKEKKKKVHNFLMPAGVAL